MEPSEVVVIVIATAFLILLLIAGIGFAFLKILRQRTEKEVALTRVKLDYERELRSIEMEISEEMKEFFAQELHDNIGHQITCIRLALETYKLDVPESAEVLTSIDDYVQAASSQVKLLSRSLNKEYLGQLSLAEAISLECDKLRTIMGLDIELKTQNAEKLNLDKDQQLILFRIVQEITNNVLKHSGARQMSIELQGQPQFKLSIEDSGKGFDLEKILGTAAASGLNNIVKRSEMAGFRCAINTAENQGCQYIIEPLINEEMTVNES